MAPSWETTALAALRSWEKYCLSLPAVNIPQRRRGGGGDGEMGRGARKRGGEKRRRRAGEDPCASELESQAEV